MYISTDVLTAAKEYAQKSPHTEVVGVFTTAAGQDKFTEFTPVKNISRAQSGTYIAEPQNLMDVIINTSAIKPSSNITPMFFHSHPHTMAFPSMMDLENAAFQGYYSIYSVAFDAINAFYFNGKMWEPRILCEF